MVNESGSADRSRIDDALAASMDSWRSGDCDSDDIAALDDLIVAAHAGDDSALIELQDAFSGSLEFGTAGLRGPMAPGPRRMNTAVVRRAAFALAHTVPTKDRIAVIGYDARHRSQDFAIESARVLSAAGWQAMLLPRALPTPVLAFAVRHLSADLGIMVTASHNPPADNGYKVYLADGRQIIEPIDSQIAAAITTAPPARDIPVSDHWRTLDDSVLESYLDIAADVIATGRNSHILRELTVVHTALHGVATDVFAAAMRHAGFAAPIEVVEQREPDPNFPTVTFPNPEEPRALDLLIEYAGTHNAHIAIAHDPDADRCAAVVATTQGWRMLTGDEVGALLGWWLLNRPDASAHPGSFAASLVSGTQLARIAEASGIPYATTLTGFKWISRVPGLAYGYEEALGYCVDPAHVADKDGITAGLLLCELAAQARAWATDLLGVLDDLALRFGVESTRQVSIRFARADQAHDIIDQLLTSPPAHIGGLSITRIADLAAGMDDLPPTPGLLAELDGAMNVDVRARVIIRPSGTEPKVKAYLLVHCAPHEDLVAARAVVEQTMHTLLAAVPALIAPPTVDSSRV